MSPAVGKDVMYGVLALDLLLSACECGHLGSDVLMAGGKVDALSVYRSDYAVNQ